MSLFVVDIEKSLNTEFWTNRYLVDVETLLAAKNAADALYLAEQKFHYSVVNFTRHRVRDIDPQVDSFITTPLGGSGALTLPGTGYLPLYNTVRVDFPAGNGRPSRKYYRCPVPEQEQVNGVLVTGTLVNALNLGLSDMLLVPLADPQATVIGLGIVQLPVQMRQLRRGSRRRTEPIL